MAKDTSAMAKDSSADIITPPENKVVLSVGVDDTAAVLQAAASAAEIHVLAVDDSTLDRKVIETLLKTSSYKVTSVDSGLKALDLLGIGVTPGPASININMIITDYCMPEMSGYDLLKRVKESSAFKEIPVVVMSSENVPTRIQRCLAEGAEEFIMKPVQLADVKRLKSHIRLPRLNLSEQAVAPCSSKRKYGSDGFQAQSPERRARLSGVTVA